MGGVDLLGLLQELLHLSEWTGLSLGTLAALALVIWLVPGLRLPAIAGVVGIACAFLGGIHEYNVGRADVRAEWDRAKLAAENAAKARDAAVAARAKAEADAALKDLGRQSAALQQQVSDYEKTILALRAGAGGAAAGAACRLGADALRLRARR